MAVATYTKSGSKATTAAKLDKDIFGIEVTDHSLLKLAYQAYLAAGRSNNAKTQTRGEVRGGGRKPWKQKGTGRARAGSIRSPLWRGGSVVFGPTGGETYKKRLPIKAKRLAIKQALSLKALDGKIAVIESIESKDGKVKPMAVLLGKINADRSALIVVEDKSTLIDRATNNIADVAIVQAKYLNVYDIMNARQIVFTKGSLQIVKEWLGGTK